MGSKAAAAIPVLVDLLDSENIVYQWDAIEALGRISDRSVVPALTEKLRSANGRTRSSAVEALSRIGDPTVMSLIRERLHDGDDSVRDAAVRSFDWSQDHDKAIPLLKELLQDRDLVVRMHAAEALGRLNDARAVDSLVDALDDDSNVCRAAARALGKLNARAAVPALIRKLGHERNWVNDSIEAALLEIGSEEAISAVRKEWGEGSTTGA